MTNLRTLIEDLKRLEGEIENQPEGGIVPQSWFRTRARDHYKDELYKVSPVLIEACEIYEKWLSSIEKNPTQISSAQDVVECRLELDALCEKK